MKTKHSKKHTAKTTTKTDAKKTAKTAKPEAVPAKPKKVEKLGVKLKSTFAYFLDGDQLKARERLGFDKKGKPMLGPTSVVATISKKMYTESYYYFIDDDGDLASIERE